MLSGMHAQTLRTYDRIGLVSPARTQGGGRRYSDRDIELLRNFRPRYVRRQKRRRFATRRTPHLLAEGLRLTL